MDAEIPFSPPSWLPPEMPELPTPPAAPPREPVWSGLELTVILLLTLAAIVFVSAAAAMLWAIGALALGYRVGAGRELPLVAISLLGQTGGLALGFVFAWLWIAQVHSTRFWKAIHWDRLPGRRVALVLGGGAATTIAVQLLGRLLPVPSDLPMDRLFTPETAWLLVIYGVGIAPFFEEFIFRGLIYPTFRATFTAGLSPQELRSWRPLVRVVGALGLLGLAAWEWRQHLLSAPASATGIGAMVLTLAAGVVLVALPRLPLAAVGWMCNRLAALGRPETLAIALTGLLFGLLHAAQLGWAWAAVVILVLVGVALTVVRAVTGSLMASWLFHCAYNGTLFALQYIATQGFRHFPPGH